LIYVLYSEAFDQDFWISASNLGGRDDFYWDSTGEFIGIFDDWMEGYPDLTNSWAGYNCVSMHNTYQWRNIYCNDRHLFVCESKPISKNINTNASTADGKMEDTKRFAIKNSVYEISSNKVSNNSNTSIESVQ
jgi:Lectin C-type domain